MLFSEQAVKDSLQQLATHRFNTVYPAVWSWGYTLYPSQVAERATGYKQGLYPDLEHQGRHDTLEAAQGDRVIVDTEAHPDDDELQALAEGKKTLNRLSIPVFNPMIRRFTAFS